MIDALFDIPLWISGLGIILVLGLFGALGLLAVRRWVLPRLKVRSEDSEFSGAMLQTVMVFYGLAVALIAVSVWQTYSDVASAISHEATTLASLDRDVGGYPEPIRTEMQNELRDYIQYIIHDAWPLQQKGQIPTGGVEKMTHFEDTMVAFQPKTDSEKILHAEALAAYNRMIQARRLRLDSVHTALPGVMWAVIVLGAFIGLSASFFFKVEDVRLHLILVTLLATFMGLVIFMIFALDRPFRGDLGLQPEPYQLIYDQLMKR